MLHCTVMDACSTSIEYHSNRVNQTVVFECVITDLWSLFTLPLAVL
jgi:hypothetical protein